MSGGRRLAWVPDRQHDRPAGASQAQQLTVRHPRLPRGRAVRSQRRDGRADGDNGQVGCERNPDRRARRDVLERGAVERDLPALRSRRGVQDPQPQHAGLVVRSRVRVSCGSDRSTDKDDVPVPASCHLPPRLEVQSPPGAPRRVALHIRAATVSREVAGSSPTRSSGRTPWLRGQEQSHPLGHRRVRTDRAPGDVCAVTDLADASSEPRSKRCPR